MRNKNLYLPSGYLDFESFSGMKRVILCRGDVTWDVSPQAR